MIEIMLDLETVDLGTKPSILQIAAVAYDMKTGKTKGTFSIFVDYKSGLKLGLTQSQSTLDWWNQQAPETKKKVFTEGPRFDITAALVNFISWALSFGTKEIYLWGNGVKADNVWIESAIKAANLKNPFSYKRDMDYRTVIRMAELKLGDKLEVKDSDHFEKHNALDDCFYQCAKLRLAWKILKMGSGWAKLLHRMNLLM